jgi:two-component system, response regulator, stage 0 sporulation protein F
VLRILVIDDDDLVRNSVQTILENAGFEVVAAANGAQATRRLDDRIDAIIVDIFMPGMDGLETIRKFREELPGVPIIALSGAKFYESGTSAPDFLIMAEKLGASASLRKPFRTKELLDMVRSRISKD